MDRFLADENVPRPIIIRLRAEGHSVASILELSAGADDETVHAEARRRGVILLTQDRDCGKLAVDLRFGVQVVILLELERLSLSAQAQRVSELLASQSSWRGMFSVIEPDRIRQRPLDDERVHQ